jgi:(2Fe-2S) ferredoxin
MAGACYDARMPRRKHYLFVCINRRADDNPKGSCAQSGSEEIHRALKEAIAQRGLASSEVRPCTSSCLDVCERGPVIAVEPDNFFYGGVKLDDVPAIVEALATGTRVERLVLTDDAFGAAKPIKLKSLKASP